MQAGGVSVAVVLFKAQQAGLEDLVSRWACRVRLFSLVTPGGDLLGLQARLGDGGGDVPVPITLKALAPSPDSRGGCTDVARPVSMSSAYAAWGL
ncbi:MAG: hypothetical protein R3C45_11530 [Phycisphaerales bacterium]